MSNFFCMLNYCLGKIYLIVPERNAGTNQLTGEFEPALYLASELKANVESGTNDNRNPDLSAGETRNGDKSIYTYKKIPLNSFVYIENAINTDGTGEIYQVTTERHFTPFMYRMIGELRYNYDLIKTTVIDPNDFAEFLTTGRTGFDHYEFDFMEF